MADKSDVIQDYLNSLNEAMAIHAKKAVEGLEFDRTELAEIVDITNRDKGEYQVFNGSTRYFAYSENTSYTLGAKVYVTIQNNDYTQQKLIKGKYKSGDGDTGISWVSPLGNYSAQTDNLIEDEAYKNLNSDTFSNSSTGLENIPVNKDYENGTGDSLLANYNKNLQEFSYEPEPDNFHYASEYKVLYLSKYMDESDDKYNKNFAYIGLSAEFKTGLSAFYPVSGSYGLLILVDYSIKISDEQPREHKLKVCKLDTTSMVGSVYNFNTFYKQEALFKLDNAPKNGMIIHQIAIIFYQDGEFRSNDNELISPLYNNELIPDNIFVRKINIQFGDDIKDDPDDKTEIYTLNGLSYDSAQTNDKLSEKRIHLKWEHKNPEKELQDDGTKKWTYKLMERQDLNNVPSAADVKIIANIHWYTDAQYTIDAYRATQAETAAENDNLFRLTEKWKYKPNGLTEEEYQELINSMNLSPKKDYDWLWDEERQMYIPNISASGEKAIDRITTRNAKEDKTASVNDELAGPGWIPIDGTFNQIDIEYQPDKERQYSRVWCIIEYGPELLTAENEGTGLVNPDSNYYTVIETNVLEFKNLSWVPDIATHDIATGIILTLDDKTDGHYPIYNATDGRILSRTEKEKLRTLKADMISRYTGNSLLNGNEIILWQIPKTNTMININGTLTDDRSEVLTTENFDDYRLAEWFELENFDFDNYYYLVRASDTLLAVNPYQGYYINEYYVKSATNNTIFCYIVKNNQIFKGQITLTFARHGSSGTDYTFSLGLGELIEMPNGVTMGGDNNAIDSSSIEWKVIGSAASALTLGETGFRKINFELYDSTNTIINLTKQEKNAIISKWILNRTQDGYYSGYNSLIGTHDGNVSNLQFLVKNEPEDGQNYYTDVAVRAPAKSKTGADLTLENYRYIILSSAVRQSAISTYKDNEYEIGPVNFVQMLPLHVKIDDKYNLEGADYITYDDKGANPQSYSDEYKLSDIDDVTFRIIVYENINNNSDVYNVAENLEALKYYPHLDEFNKLVPSSIYVSNLSKKIAVEALDGENNLIYTMPLLIIQNRYQIPAINSWNGQLLIDEQNNRVMAATIAAGSKDEENRFTGVIMGDVGQQNQVNNRVTTTTGLYGYHTGAEAFGFKADGTAFIGKPGTGRIEFDGEKGTIQSANYNVSSGSSKEGTKIDLDDGSIDMWGRGNSWRYDSNQNKYIVDTNDNILSTNIHLDTLGTISKPYFKIEVPKFTTVTDSTGNIVSTQTSNRQSLIQIDKSNFYLQTADYDTVNNTGLRIDLKKGTFDSKGKLTINGAVGSQIYFGESKNYLNLGVNSSGSYFEMESKPMDESEALSNLRTLRSQMNQIFTNPAPTYSNWKVTNETALKNELNSWASNITSLQTQIDTNAAAITTARKEYDEAEVAYNNALLIYNTYNDELIEMQRISNLSETEAQNNVTTTLATYENLRDVVVPAAQSDYDTKLEITNNAYMAWQRKITEKEALVAQKNNLQSDKTILESDIQQLNSQKQSLEWQLSIYQQQLQIAQNDPETTQERLDEINNNISTTQAQLDDVNDTISSKQTSLNTVTTQLNDILLRLDGNNTVTYPGIDAEIVAAKQDYEDKLAISDAAYEVLQTENENLINAEIAWNDAVRILTNLQEEKQDANTRILELQSSNLLGTVNNPGQIVLNKNNAENVKNTKEIALNNALNNAETLNASLSQATEKYNSGTRILNEYSYAYNVYQEAKSGSGGEKYIKLSNTANPRLQIGSNFKVDSKGNITANGGTIGGWNITSDALTGGNMRINSNGSMSGSHWYINTDGTASFTNSFTVGGGGYNSPGFSFGNGGAHFYGDIYATNGYFTGKVNASTISGGTITGATISGGSITGTTISAKGYVTCSGLRVKGTEYTMTNKTVVSYIDRENAGWGVTASFTWIDGLTGYCDLSTGAVTIGGFSVPLPLAKRSATHINLTRTASLTYLGKYVDA